MPTVADIRDGLKVWKQNYLPPPARQLDEPEMNAEEKAKVQTMIQDLARKLDIRATVKTPEITSEGK